MIQRAVSVNRFVLLAAIFLFYVYPAAAEKICTDCGQGSEITSTDIDCTPHVWVEVVPVFFDKSPADHTYIKAMQKNGTCDAWPCFGRDSGGKKLADTQSDIAEEAIPAVAVLADASPCNWQDHFISSSVCATSWPPWPVGKTLMKE